MAGVGAVLSSMSEGAWPLCHDGSFLQPLDILFLLFKNKGRNATGFSTCFVGEHFQFDPLLRILPESNMFFTADEFADSLICLLITSIVATLAMIMSKCVWERIDQQFASISPSHKKWYVIANLTKSFVLGCQCLSSRYWITSYHGFVYDNLNALTVKRCAMLYVSMDVVALFIVPKLPLSTKVHHVTTTFVIMMISAVNIEAKGYSSWLGVAKMAIMYGIFSTMAFMVNTYLALRVYSKGTWLHLLAQMSLWPYVIFCACNWTVHLAWLCSLVYSLELSTVNVVYLMAISAMVNDDIVLIKWLIRRSSPGVGEGAADEQKQPSSCS